MRILMGALAATVFGLPALAADLPVKARPVPVAEVWNWTGFYIGANVGYSWGRDPVDFSGTSTTRTRVFRAFGTPAETLTTDVTTAGPTIAGTDRANLNGWVGGGQIGYNIQSGAWVWGLEADLQGTGQRGGLTFCATAGCPVGSVFEAADYKLKWFGTVRARLGMLVDPRVLLYVTGGLAYGQAEGTFSAGFIGGPSAVATVSTTNAGWVIGGGLEAMLSRNWSVKGEYLHMELGTLASTGLSGTSTVITPGVPQVGFTTVVDTTVTQGVSSRIRDNILRIGINYHFDAGPVVARY